MHGGNGVFVSKHLGTLTARHACVQVTLPFMLAATEVVSALYLYMLEQEKRTVGKQHSAEHPLELEALAPKSPSVGVHDRP